MTGQNRRRFLQSSLAAGATFAISGTKSSGNILGANDRLRVAVAGLHGRGRSHYGAYARMKDVQVAYVVDPDSRQYSRAINDVKNTSSPGELRSFSLSPSFSVQTIVPNVNKIIGDL